MTAHEGTVEHEGRLTITHHPRGAAFEWPGDCEMIVWFDFARVLAVGVALVAGLVFALVGPWDIWGEYDAMDFTLSIFFFALVAWLPTWGLVWIVLLLTNRIVGWTTVTTLWLQPEGVTLLRRRWGKPKPVLAMPTRLLHVSGYGENATIDVSRRPGQTKTKVVRRERGLRLSCGDGVEVKVGQGLDANERNELKRRLCERL